MLETNLTNDEVAHSPLPAKPRLSMKYLHILIQDLQDQDQLLSQRIVRMEQQLSGFNDSRDEIAAADEQMRNQAESTTSDIQSQIVHSQDIQISRAERHARPKKKSFRFW